MMSVIILGSILSVGCEDLCIRVKRMNLTLHLHMVPRSRIHLALTSVPPCKIMRLDMV